MLPLSEGITLIRVTSASCLLTHQPHRLYVGYSRAMMNERDAKLQSLGFISCARASRTSRTRWLNADPSSVQEKSTR